MSTNTGRGTTTPDDDLYDDDDEDTMRDRYLAFRLAEEDYGFPIRCVTEIIAMQRITEMPDVAEYVKGVVNLRGKVIPVMDVRIRFGMPERKYDDRTCIVVVDHEGTAVGLIVDRVAEVIDIPGDQIDPPPTIHKGANHRFIQGLGKVENDVKILLDVGKLLDNTMNGSAEVAPA